MSFFPPMQFPNMPKDFKKTKQSDAAKKYTEKYSKSDNSADHEGQGDNAAKQSKTENPKKSNLFLQSFNTIICAVVASVIAGVILIPITRNWSSIWCAVRAFFT